MKSPERHSIEALFEGQEARFQFVISDDDMKRFADLSGDFNPLHCEAAHACEAGFEGPVVYGALLLAKVSRMIGMHLPGLDSVWNSIRFDFRKPLYVGQEAELIATVEHVSEAARAVSLRLEIRAGDTPVARGKAGVTLRRSGLTDG